MTRWETTQFQWKNSDALHEIQTYIDIVKEDLKEKFDTKFDQLKKLLSLTKKVFL
jgi:hypothetical protein